MALAGELLAAVVAPLPDPELEVDEDGDADPEDDVKDKVERDVHKRVAGNGVVNDETEAKDVKDGDLDPGPLVQAVGAALGVVLGEVAGTEEALGRGHEEEREGRDEVDGAERVLERGDGRGEDKDGRELVEGLDGAKAEAVRELEEVERGDEEGSEADALDGDERLVTKHCRDGGELEDKGDSTNEQGEDGENRAVLPLLLDQAELVRVLDQGGVPGREDSLDKLGSDNDGNEEVNAVGGVEGRVPASLVLTLHEDLDARVDVRVARHLDAADVGLVLLVGGEGADEAVGEVVGGDDLKVVALDAHVAAGRADVLAVDLRAELEHADVEETAGNVVAAKVPHVSNLLGVEEVAHAVVKRVVLLVVAVAVLLGASTRLVGIVLGPDLRVVVPLVETDPLGHGRHLEREDDLGRPGPAAEGGCVLCDLLLVVQGEEGDELEREGLVDVGVLKVEDDRRGDIVVLDEERRDGVVLGDTEERGARRVEVT